MSFNFVIPEMVINNDEWTLSPFRFFRRGFLLNTSSGSTPSWKDVILHGNTALTLVNSKAGGLNYLKLFGGTEQLAETYIDSVTLEGKCEQNGTPTPTVPVDIVCNNGAIKYGYATVNLNVGTLDNQGYTSTGGESSSSTFCGTLWKIKVSEGETYAVSYGNFPDGVSGVFVNTWKTDSTFNTRQAIAVPQQGYWTYTIPQGVGEVNFTLYKTGGITIASNSWMQVELGSTPTSYVPASYGIYANSTTETVTDSLGNTATAQMLLSVSTYKDTQEVLTGAVTRNVGVYVFDGTETFSTSNATFTYAVRDKVSAKTNLLCSHFEYSTKTSSQVEDGKIISFASTNIGFRYDACADTTAFKAWLKSQYDNGTPVIVVYPLATATTETVTPQVLNKEPVTVTGSLSDLVSTVVSSSHTTPTPTQPLQINTNNGILKVNSQGQVYADGTVETVQVHGINIFDKNTMDTGQGYYVNSGLVANAVNNNRTFVIDCKPNTKYSWWHTEGAGGARAFDMPTDTIATGDTASWLTSSNPTYRDKNVITTVTTRANAKKLYICVARKDANITRDFDDQINDFMVVEGEVSTATTYEQYYNGGSATAEMLCGLTNHLDEQNITNGAISRKTGIKIFTGTESGWTMYNSLIVLTSGASDAEKLSTTPACYCTHYTGISPDLGGSAMSEKSIKFGYKTGSETIQNYIYVKDSSFADATEFKAFLADQYNAGHPVICVYPLATPTTETVTPQPLTIQAGTNIVEITQASIDDLELEVSYKAGVEVTVTEIENAQLDNSVEVTVNG